jgi:uroporphyrinogen-III synthase
MKTVFISRNLKPDSIFKQMLENQDFKVFGMSLVSFQKIDFALPQKPDWLFFYSKNGVRFFLEKVDLAYFKNVKIGTIGEGTAAFLESKNLTVAFTGNGNPEETARQFSRVASGSKVLFARAKNSKKSVQTNLNDAIEIQDLIVYENLPKSNVAIRDFDVLVFTSPMNVETYFENKKLIDNQQVIAIGATTATALQNLNIHDFIISKEPSESALAAAVLLV